MVYQEANQCIHLTTKSAAPIVALLFASSDAVVMC